MSLLHVYRACLAPRRKCDYSRTHVMVLLFLVVLGWC
jgi:hypothetical protein